MAPTFSAFQLEEGGQATAMWLNWRPESSSQNLEPKWLEPHCIYTYMFIIVYIYILYMRLSLPFLLLSSLRLSADSHESGLLAKKENPVHCLLTSILHSPAGMRGLSL